MVHFGRVLTTYEGAGADTVERLSQVTNCRFSIVKPDYPLYKIAVTIGRTFGTFPITSSWLHSLPTSYAASCVVCLLKHSSTQTILMCVSTF
jgi:hypothetical protein